MKRDATSRLRQIGWTVWPLIIMLSFLLAIVSFFLAVQAGRLLGVQLPVQGVTASLAISVVVYGLTLGYILLVAKLFIKHLVEVLFKFIFHNDNDLFE